jgi:putative sigma-54 modulation protein
MRRSIFMNVKITAKKMTVSDSFKEYAQDKLDSKLDKFFGGQADAKIVLTEIKSDIIVELTVKYDGILFRAEQRAADKRDALDADVDKIVRQIRRNKTKIEKKLKDVSFDIPFDDSIDESEIQISRHKKFVMHPMSEEEAVLQMELLGHDFFMFRNAETGDVNVVYKRSQGDYAVLIPEDE